MGKKIIKMSVAAVCVVAAGVIGMKAYNVADQAKVNMLLVQNVDALSAGDYIETELAEQEAEQQAKYSIATMCPFSSYSTCYKDITIHNIGTGKDFTFNHYAYKDHTDNYKESIAGRAEKFMEEQEEQDEKWKNRDPASIIEIPNKNKGNENGSSTGNENGYSKSNGNEKPTVKYACIYYDSKDVWWEEKDEKGWYLIHIGRTRKTIREDPSRWIKSHRDEVDRWLREAKYSY